tara:strand:- start:354745 stop:355866 length:1122 start_codon:yes stop_codon:yes gene_type:complete
MTETPEPRDHLLEGIMALVPPLLEALETLGFVARYMHPPHLDELLERVADGDAAVIAGREIFAATDWPDDLKNFAAQVEKVADEVCSSFEGLRAAQSDPNGVFATYRGLRHISRAAEALYPISAMLPPVSPYFLEPDVRGDKALAERLAAADMARPDAGVHHMGNEKQMRGGFSLYVPETYDATRATPLIIAMHGGSGHGRDFLWSWVASARTRGAILIAPTSTGPTWDFTAPERDNSNILRMIDYVGEQWNIDRSRMLLTGMSDGGTFSYVLGMEAQAPFTHLAPIAASFHPMLAEFADADRVKGLPLYITHGKLDWMFNVDMARNARNAMSAAGADVVYREISDLSHTYPREENPRIMDWFLNGIKPDAGQ